MERERETKRKRSAVNETKYAKDKVAGPKQRNCNVSL